MKAEHFELIINWKIRIGSVLILLSNLFFYVFYGWNKFPKASYGSLSYGDDPWMVLWRFLWYIQSFICLFAALSLIPQRNLGPITRWGQNTIYPMLLHELFIALCIRWEIFKKGLDHEWSPVIVILFTIVAILLCIGLSTYPVRWLMWPIIEPNLSILFKLHHPNHQQPSHREKSEYKPILDKEDTTTSVPFVSLE